ncbi:hypothetical protein HK103_004591 [Boothiomyces macroporosus]|uniref:Pentatricopeptide repeat-containing protein-mitochondrial domain-containing protein n=1 Tax=Boothiomyces macroporosus TaxID=261099 RepID=A0AAD5UGE7_9FUNG|nr:hypothetical protein HK103_004591 [Boothiomyces macroporosus]
MLKCRSIVRRVSTKTDQPKWQLKVQKKKLKEQMAQNFRLCDDFPETDKITALPKITEERDHKADIDLFNKTIDDHFKLFHLFTTIKGHKFDAGRLLNLMNKMSCSKILHPETRLFRTELVFNKLREYNAPTPFAYISLARAAQHTFTNREQVDQFIERMQKDQIKVERGHNVYFILGLLENGNVDDAQRYYQLPNDLAITSYYFIQAYLKKQDLQSVQIILKNMKNNSVLLGVSTATQILQGILDNFNQSTLDYTLKVLKHEGSEWSLGIFRNLHAIYSKYLPDRLSALEDQIKEKYNLDQIVARNKLLECCKAKNLEQVDKIYDETTRAGVIIEPYVMNSIVNMIAELVDADRSKLPYLMAKANLYQMRILQSLQYCYETTFMNMLKMFAATGNYTRAVSLIKQINRRAFNTTAEHYYYLVDAHCQRGSVMRTQEVIKEMVQSKIKPTVKIFNRLIKAYLDQHISQEPNPNWKKAFQYLNDLRACRLPLAETTIQLFTDMLSLTNNLEQSKLWFEEMEKFGDIQNVSIINHMMKMFNMRKGDNLEHVEQYYDKLVMNQLQPNAETYEQLLVAYKKVQDVAESTKVWNEAVQNGMKVTTNMVGIMLELAADLNDKQLAMKLWEDIKNTKLRNPSALQYVQTLIVFDDYADAKEIFSKLESPDIKTSALMTAKFPELLGPLHEKAPFVWKYLTLNTIPEDSLNSRKLHKVQLSIHLENAKIKRESKKRAREVSIDNKRVQKHGRELPTPIDLSQVDEFQTEDDVLQK